MKVVRRILYRYTRARETVYARGHNAGKINIYAAQRFLKVSSFPVANSRSEKKTKVFLYFYFATTLLPPPPDSATFPRTHAAAAYSPLHAYCYPPENTECQYTFYIVCARVHPGSKLRWRRQRLCQNNIFLINNIYIYIFAEISTIHRSYVMPTQERQKSKTTNSTGGVYTVTPYFYCVTNVAFFLRFY